MNEQDLRHNPFVGLRPFFIDDSLYFFGREQQTAELLEILHQHRFLGVVGSSGSGKSSLVRAGLLPALLGGFMVEDRDRWRIVQMKPGVAPIGNLASGLLEAMEEAATKDARAELEQLIRDGHTDAVVEFLTPRLENKGNLFILVDQFEEIFAFRGLDAEEGPASADPARRKERALRKAEAADFVDLMIALANRREQPIYVALTMRTDFLGDCDLFYGFPEALNRGRYLVPRLARQELRGAIEGPAKLMRARIAPRLLDHLLNELGDRFDRLPVLQHALLRTWDAWQRAGDVGSIDLRHFEATGGLEGALDKDAEGALQGLDVGVTARVFKRLTDTDPSQRRVRSPARISELMAVSGAERGTVEGIVRRFEEDGRSFVHRSADGKPDDPRVDISHESLIRQWAALRNWVDEERRSRDRYLELLARARKREHGEAALLWDSDLRVYINWKEEQAPSPEWARRYSGVEDDFDRALGYLDESLKLRCHQLATAELQRRWRRWSQLILVIEVAIGLVLANKVDLFLTLASLGWSAEEEEQRQRGELSLWRALQGMYRKFLNEEFLTAWFPAILLFLAACVGLNFGVKWVHRRYAFPRILRGIVSSGGRNPAEVTAKDGELQDAVVAHHTTYASTFRRVVGYAIDWLCFASLIGVVFFMVSVVGAAGALPVVAGNDDRMVEFALIVSFVFAWLYETLPIVSSQQSTWGMKFAGIFRTDPQGERLSFGRATAWWLYRLLSYGMYGLGFVVQPFTRKRQTLHDWMAETVVLSRPVTPRLGRPLARIAILVGLGLVAIPGVLRVVEMFGETSTVETEPAPLPSETRQIVIAGPKPPYKTGDVFQECAECPEMVVIVPEPTGFTIGTPDLQAELGRQDDEKPFGPIRFAKPYAISRFEITRGQFRASGVQPDAGCHWIGKEWQLDEKPSWERPGFEQDDDHPVVCVGWEDAQKYPGWLNGHLGLAGGAGYSLPSEAQWEYAARAGTTTTFYWGNEPAQACGFANVADHSAKATFADWTIHECGDGFVHTAPVGRFKPNAYGLHDTIGNVWEWVQDCYVEKYSEQIREGSAYEATPCVGRVLRGGSWGDAPGYARAAVRNWIRPGGRANEIGFRLARTL